MLSVSLGPQGKAHRSSQAKRQINTGSFSQCVRPGMQLASSWIPGGLISAEPQQALLIFVLFLSLFCFFSYILSFFLFLFCFGGPHPGHMVVPREGVQVELQLPATALAPAPAPATQDPSLLFKLHHSSRQCQILNTRIEAETSWVLVGLFQLCHDGTSFSQLSSLM